MVGLRLELNCYYIQGAMGLFYNGDWSNEDTVLLCLSMSPWTEF